jgi:two-component system chemotaxis response regulator CheB
MMMEKLIIVGGSAGSFKVVSNMLAALKPNPRFSYIICLHRLRNVRSGFVEALSINSGVPLLEPNDKDPVKPGHAYLAPANYHLMPDFGYTLSLSVDSPVNHSRPSIDVCMETAAEALQDKAIGILLSGANSDGARGMHKIHEKGGLTIIQDPEDCEIGVMPSSVLGLFKPDYVLSANKIINFICHL